MRLHPLIFSDCRSQSLRHLEQTFREIKDTAGSVKLSLTHGTAAWNCVSGFLELGILSSDSRLRDFCYASTTWIEVFGLFLSRSHNAKSKPLKQILLTLTKLLMRQPDTSAAISIKKHVITSTVTMIGEDSNESSVKPAFQTLQHFLSKGVIESTDIVNELARERFRREGNGVDTSEEALWFSNSIFDFSPLCVKLIENFTSSILEWLKYPDIAPIAGHLLHSFFKSFQYRSNQNHQEESLKNKLLLWTKPLTEFIKNEPSLLEICESHVLPGMLELNPNDTMTFLNTFPLVDLKEGKTGNLDFIDIQLCLSTLKFCVDKSISKASHMVR